MYKCKECDFEAESGPKLGQHVTVKHRTIRKHIKKEFIKNCLKCGNDFKVLRSEKNNFKIPKKEKTHCSILCSKSRDWTKEQKEKISLSCKNSEKVINENRRKNRSEKLKKIKFSSCKVCNKTFENLRNKKTCSDVCFKKTVGGYREGSGRAKTGYYKGIYCGSSWELAWVIYMIDHNLPFKRFPNLLVGNNIKYMPDFLIGENTIVEIKGFEDQSLVDEKTRLAESRGYKVIVLRKNELKEHFDWVKDNYKYKNLWDLYDK